MKKTSFYELIGFYSVKYRYLVIAFWLAAACMVTWFAPDLSELSISDQSAYLSDREPSIRAQKMIKKYFPTEVFSNSAVLVLESKTGSLRNPGGMAVLADLTRWIRSQHDPKISETLLSPIDPNLTDRLTSADGSVALIFAGINGAPDDRAVEKTMSNLKRRMERVPAGYRGYVTGDVAITNAYKVCILESAGKTILITVVLVVVCLLLIYRSPILPFVPLLIIGVAFGISRGIVAWLAQRGMVISSMTELFMVVLLFGAGTDYCLFIISRFKEYMADGLSGFEASTNTMARVGETITSSAGTLIVADIALSFVSVKLFASTGPSLAIALFIALGTVMTLTPAMLAIVGSIAFWPGKPRHAHEANLWGRMGDWITRMPWVPLGLSLALMVPLAFYGQGQKQTFDMLADLPEDNMARTGYNLLSAKFGVGEMLPVDLLTTGLRDMRTPEGIAAIAKTTRELLQLPGVADVRSLTSPTGKPDAYAAKILRVDFQLTQVADQVSSFAASLDDPFTRNTFVAGAQSRFRLLRDYFASLAGAFPALSREQEYRNTTGSLERLQDRYAAILPLLQVPGQLADIDRRMRHFSGITPATVLPQLEMLQSYFAGLVQLAPQVARMEGYNGTLSALSHLHARYVALRGMPGVPRLLSMLGQKDELETLKKQLADNLHSLADDGNAQLAGIIYIPPILPPEMGATVNPIAQEMKTFENAVRQLSARFARIPDGFYAPIELARIQQEGNALLMLLNTYTTLRGDAVRYQLLLRDQPFSPAAMDAVRQIRKMKMPTPFYVGGNIPVLTDLRDAMKRDTGLMWVLVCGGIMIVLVFLLRSLVAPIYLLGTILLSYNACMGIMRFVFEFLLGAQITWFVPFFMFVLLLALGMDYNIFLMGRVKEEVAVHGTRKGVRLAVLHTGGIITSAGIIMAGTFAAMMSSSLLGLVQLSFAITVGVLQDTFITRTTLVPAIVVLLDKWNWWPGRIARKERVEEAATSHDFS